MNLLDIKGLGEKRLNILNDVGIFDINDLCAFFPKEYFDTTLCSVDSCDDGDYVLLSAKITAVPVTKFARKGFNYTIISAKCNLSGINFKIIYYNRPYLSKSLKQDQDYLIFGQASVSKDVTVLNPIMELSDNPKQLKGIITVYNRIKGIPSNALRDFIKYALPKLEVHSILTDEQKRKYELIDLKKAYNILHYPKSLQEIEQATKTVAIEELTKTITAFWLLKNYDKKYRSFQYVDVSKNINQKIIELPYELTSDQINALNDILTDFSKPEIMNRLIEGDVGSGKSIVAFMALYYVVLNGKQGIIMAPTEILARQHYINLKKLFPELNITFLSSGLKKEEKENALLEIKTSSQIIVGTHSLFQEGVIFKNPTLAVIDEQHRFGVSQRKALEDKGETMDILLLSATPIPRTLSLVVYGDLDISFIKTNPKSRAGVETKFVPQNKIQDMFDYIIDQASKNIQTYIVAPKIEDEDEFSGVSAQSLYETLLKRLKGLKVGLIHGKMKESQKAKIMNDFKLQKIDVLVSTTVIEVGIDVPSAAIMVIFDAHKFGLSQLHQLRGRIGRGSIKGYCFLVSNCRNPDSLKRLEVFKKNHDGFFLAEYDMTVRGMGDFLGTRQHGLAGVFNNLKIKPEWVNISKELSDQILNNCNNDNKKTKQIIDFIGYKYQKLLKNVTLN
ncbi:MAG TPA: ATP-dependent DNA helicase RecG [Clostridia bacterium]